MKSSSGLNNWCQEDFGQLLHVYIAITQSCPSIWNSTVPFPTDQWLHVDEEWTQETKQTANLNQVIIDYKEENDVQCHFSKDIEESYYH